MSIGSWDPTSSTTQSGNAIDSATLRHFVDIAMNCDITATPINLAERLTAEQQQHFAMMQADQKAWDTALVNYTEQQLLALIPFFTLIEAQLGDWVGGQKSPVIWMTKRLKSEGKKLPKELQQWIRENSTNRYLPNGPIV